VPPPDTKPITRPDWRPPRGADAAAAGSVGAAVLEAAGTVTIGRLVPGEDSGIEDVTAYIAPGGRPPHRRGGQ